MRPGCLLPAKEDSHSKEVSCTYTWQPLPHALDRSKGWNRVTAQPMSQVKYILTFICLALSFLVSAPDKSLSNNLHLCRADAADMEGYTADAEPIPIPYKWHSPLKRVAKRKLDSVALPLVIHSLSMPTCHHALSRPCRSSTTVVYQATPLHQSLQVYRF